MIDQDTLKRGSTKSFERKHFNNIAILQNLSAKYFDPPTFCGLIVSKSH